MVAAPDLNWKELGKLRELYLEGTAGRSDYWSYELLRAYDLTLGARIGWKWDHVLEELKQRGFSPPANAWITDWGCGTGVASRRLMAAWPELEPNAFVVLDRSPKATEYAAERLMDLAPKAMVHRNLPNKAHAPGLLLISHVITELDANALKTLLDLAQRSDQVIWVEPGTHSASRALGSIRDVLSPSHHIVAPCGHQDACGIFAPENQRHWCHQFAAPPPEAHHDPLWNRFADRLGIDWRTLPLSYLAFKRRNPVTEPENKGLSHEGTVIGYPRRQKGGSRQLVCTNTGVRETFIGKGKQRDRAEAKA